MNNRPGSDRGHSVHLLKTNWLTDQKSAGLCPLNDRIPDMYKNLKVPLITRFVNSRQRSNEQINRNKVQKMIKCSEKDEK